MSTNMLGCGALDYLSGVGSGKLILAPFPEIEFYTQSLSIPATRVIYPETQGPRYRFVHAPQSVHYDPFVLKFIVTQNMGNYSSLLNWFQDALDNPNVDCFSDGKLLILNAQKTVVNEITFERMMPVSLSGLEVNYTDEQVQYQTATAVFEYKKYNFKT